MVSKASLLDFESSFRDIPRSFSLLLSRLQELRESSANESPSLAGSVGLLFFESSTRTKLSFATAALRVGLTPLYFDPAAGGTSADKGETQEDSVLNIAAMGPSVLVIRCGDDLDLRSLDGQVEAPILNAGWGKRGHPTQALGDAATLAMRWGSLKNKKLLVVGDIRHSRVAHSHFELMPHLGVQMGVCGPDTFLGEERPGVERFSNLQEGLRWCDAVMALRVQLERHGGSGFNAIEFTKKYSLNAESIRSLRDEALILHPGPVNWGVELSHEIKRDPRSQILQQVRMGVQVRRALLDRALGRWTCN